MANLYKRSTYVTLDEYGIDPLRDKALNVLDQVTDYVEYTVGLEAQENLPLIAYKRYGNKDLWWIIAAYNGILDITEVVAGTVLRLPTTQALTSLFVDVLQPGVISPLQGTEF